MFLDKLKQSLSRYHHVSKVSFKKIFALEKKINFNLLGLEINSEYIKLLKINSKNEVESFAVEKIPAGVIVKNEIKDPEALRKSLKTVIKEASLNTKNVAFSIPRSSAIIKHITINKNLRADEIESRVWLEANKLFPDLIQDIYLDFIPMGLSEQDPSRQEVTLVACRKGQLQPYLNLLGEIHLNAKVVDINSYALERALLAICKNEPDYHCVALLNLNFSLFTLIVVHEGNLVYTHELNPDISPNDLDNVDSLKKSLGLHLRHTMQFFYSSRPNVRIEKVIVSGDCAAAIPNLATFIQAETNKETLLADPFKNMGLSSSIDSENFKRYAPALLLCCGLSLTHIS